MLNSVILEHLPDDVSPLTYIRPLLEVQVLNWSEVDHDFFLKISVEETSDIGRLRHYTGAIKLTR